MQTGRDRRIINSAIKNGRIWWKGKETNTEDYRKGKKIKPKKLSEHKHLTARKIIRLAEANAILELTDLSDLELTQNTRMLLKDAEAVRSKAKPINHNWVNVKGVKKFVSLWEYQGQTYKLDGSGSFL